MIGACSVLAATVLLVSAPEAWSRIAVIVVGDALDAGRLQADIEKELDRQGARVKPAAEIALALGIPAYGGTDAPPQQLQNARTKLVEADAAFLRGEFDLARTATQEAQKILAALPPEATLDERTQAHLWSALATLQTDAKAAQLEIEELLRDVAPDPVVSADIFPPDFIALVNAQRKNLKTTTVRLTDLPAGAEAWVNGRKVDVMNPFVVVVHPSNKPNIVTVRAPGYRTAVFTLPASAPMRSLPLALALPPESDAAVRAALGRKSDETMERALATLTERIGAGALLLLETRGKAAPAAMLWKGGALRPLVATNQAALVAAALRSGDRKRSAGLAVVTAGAMDVSLWQRALGGGGGYTLPLTGTGPRVTTDILWNSLIASAEVSYLHYVADTDTTVTGGADDGRSFAIDGGNALRVAAGAGGTRTIGNLSGGMLVGGRFEQYSAKVVRVESAGGASYPVAGPHTWTGAQAEVRMGYRAGLVAVDGGAGVVFASTYREGEAGMSGASPVVAAAPFWRLGGSYAASERVAIGLRYSGESRSTAFKGEPALQQTTPRKDLVLTDFLTTVSATASYAF